MKIRILSILLVALMLLTTVATATGCSYNFHNKRYAEELAMITADTYKNMDISVSVKGDDLDFLQAYYGITSMDKYLDENIKDSLRALTYKDANKKTISFMGTDKAPDKNIELDDDATVYYLIKYVDADKSIVKQYYNLASVISAKDIGSGNLYGVNFEEELVKQGIGSEGTRGSFDAKTAGYIYTDYKHVADDEDKTESTGYDVWYITLSAEKADDEGIYLKDAYGNDYDGKTTIRVDMKDIDFATGTGKLDADGNKLISDDIAGIIKKLVDDRNEYVDNPGTEVNEAEDKSRFKIGALMGGYNSYQIGENQYEISVKLERAQKESFSSKEFEVTLDSSSKVIHTDIVGKKVSVQVIVTEVKEYNINADISEFCKEAGWKDADGNADFKKLLTAMDSSFSSSTAVETNADGSKNFAKYQSDLIKEYREYIKTSNYERIENELVTGAKDALFTAIVAVAKAGIAEDDYPSKAVKECKKEALNNAKATYSSYYSTAYESFEKYLTAQYSASSYDEALVKLEAECRDVVLEKMVIMRVAGIMGVTVTKAEYDAEVEKFEAQYKDILAFYQAYGYTDAKNVVDYLGGEENIYIAMYYARVMNSIYSAHFKSIQDIPKTRSES